MVSFDPSANNFIQAAGANSEIFKMLKKEEKKGAKSKLLSAMHEFNITHEKFKEEVAKSISEEMGLNIPANSEMVENFVFSLSLGKIYESRDGEITLTPDLKSAFQHFDSESPQAKEAVASRLSQGSKQRVSSSDKIIDRDIDDVALRINDNPDMLYSEDK